MKKSLLLTISVIVLLLGCSKEQISDQTEYRGPVTTVQATFEGLQEPGATKAAVTDAGAFTWQNGDIASFTIADSGSNTIYGTGTNSAEGTTANFLIAGSLSADPWAFYPSDLTTGQETSSLTVNVPASRAWVANQTNVAMYGKYAAPNFNFCHLGGLVRVRVVNVPTTATKFVFKTPGKKINGEFSVSTSGDYKVIDTADSSSETEQTYTLTFTSPAANTTMDFYIPLPVGTYSGGFSFYLKDGSDTVLSKVEGSTSQTVARKALLLMPAITLAEGTIEGGEKKATAQTIPAGYSGDFLLAQSENVVLTIEGSAGNDINLKYNAGTLPANLEIKVNGTLSGTLSGNLSSTHVEFTSGTIGTVTLTTSATTLEVINPAKIIGKLTVNGGNVAIKGATVGSVEIAAGAVADANTSAPVQVVVEKKDETAPVITSGITAKANVVVAPAQDLTVNVIAESDVKVANEGAGSVTGATTTTADAKIGDQNYFSLADAIAGVKDGETIILQQNVAKAAGISVPSGKNFTIDFGGKTYSTECPGAGSAGTQTIAFQLLQNSTIVFKNGTINCTEANKTKTWSSGDQTKGIAMIIQNYANLTLDCMTIDAANIAHNGNNVRYAVSNNCGTVEFKGNTTIKAPVDGDYAFDVCKYQSYDAPTVTWNSTGSVDGFIELSGGSFTVASNLALTKPIKAVAAAAMTVNSNITPASGWTGGDGLVIVRRGGDLTLSGNGKISYNDNTAVYEAVKMTELGEAAEASDDTQRAKLTLNGPTLEGYYYGITGNGKRQGTDVIITSGTVKGCKTNDCAGIYHPQNGTLTINGGTIEGATGIYVKSGTVTTSVNGGTIKGTGAEAAYQTTGDGFVSTGDGLLFDNCDYPGGAPNATINGGTFTSANGLAVASYAKAGKTPIVPVINGGTFSDETALKYVAANANVTVKLQADRTAGTGVFVKADQNQTITFDLNGHTFTAAGPAVGSAGTVTQAFHLEKGNDIIIKNGTINCAEANKDKTWSSGDSDKGIAMIIQNYANLTLDGMTIDAANIAHNGNNVRYAVSNNCGTVEFKGATTIKALASDCAFDVCKSGSYTEPSVTWNSTGTVEGCIELTGGTFTVAKNLQVNTPIVAKDAAANLVVNAEITPAVTLNAVAGTKDAVILIRRTGNLTISGAGTIDSKTIGSAIKMTTSGDSGDAAATLTVNSGTFVGDYYAISGNGSRHNTNITINGGTFRGNHSNDNLAIFHPQNGTLTISNGTFEGYSSAVEMRAGTLNITGGSFTSTATSYSCTANSSGNTTVGAALAIAQHDTGLGISATITGATFTGNYKLSVKDPQGKGWNNVSVNWFGTTYSTETTLQ